METDRDAEVAMLRDSELSLSEKATTSRARQRRSLPDEWIRRPALLSDAVDHHGGEEGRRQRAGERGKAEGERKSAGCGGSAGSKTREEERDSALRERRWIGERQQIGERRGGRDWGRSEIGRAHV